MTKGFRWWRTRARPWGREERPSFNLSPPSHHVFLPSSRHSLVTGWHIALSVGCPHLGVPGLASRWPVAASNHTAIPTESWNYNFHEAPPYIQDNNTGGAIPTSPRSSLKREPGNCWLVIRYPGSSLRGVFQKYRGVILTQDQKNQNIWKGSWASTHICFAEFQLIPKRRSGEEPRINPITVYFP